MDVFADVLRAIRLKGSVYFNACFCSPWGMIIEQEKKASFHLIVEGDAWLTLPETNEQLKLSAGDIVLFPKGSPHSISDKADGKCLEGPKVVEAYQGGKTLFDGDQQAINIICGYVEFDDSLSHPFMDHLPSLIHITPAIRTQFYWLDNIIKQIIAETQHNEPGSEVLIDKYTEVLFIQIIRAYSKQAEHELSYFSALLDKHISHALQLIHSQPEKEWTVDILAAEVGLSRSSFYSKFNDMVGLPPMKYVFKWRMLQARDKLNNTQKPMVTIAEEVGYQSEGAFQKAFKRFFSLTPAAVRKTARDKGLD